MKNVLRRALPLLLAAALLLPLTACEDKKNIKIQAGTMVIADSAFENNALIETVEIPDSVTRIGARARSKTA